MSMMSNAGSSAAANDVMAYILKLIQDEKLEEDYSSYAVAMKIYKYAEEIRNAADSGWY